MEKRDAVVLLAMLGCGSYAVYANWDVIVDKLDLQQLEPKRLKAIDLAKKANTFSFAVTNWQELQTRQQRGEIELSPEPWSAELIEQQRFHVVVRWVEEGSPVAHGFKVDIATRVVIHEGELSTAAAPR